MTTASDESFVLSTARLGLRELRLDVDESFILELLNEPGFVRYIGDKGVRTREDAARYIEAQRESYRQFGFGLWLVELSGSGDPIGICGLLRRPTIEEVEVGFAYLERVWGRGFAFEAASSVLRFGFENIDLPGIVAITDPANEGSINVIRKLGMEFERMIPLPGFESERTLFGLDRVTFLRRKKPAEQEE